MSMTNCYHYNLLKTKPASIRYSVSQTVDWFRMLCHQSWLRSLVCLREVPSPDKHQGRCWSHCAGCNMEQEPLSAGRHGLQDRARSSQCEWKWRGTARCWVPPDDWRSWGGWCCARRCFSPTYSSYGKTASWCVRRQTFPVWCGLPGQHFARLSK